jgi:DNA modification methylase
MVALVNQSCFDFLKLIQDGVVDLCLIDPPYEISRETNFDMGDRGLKKYQISMDFGDWDSNFTGLDIVLKECFRVLEPGGTCICFYDLWKISVLKDYFEQAGFRQLRFLEWIKTNPVPINSKINYLTNAREIAVVGIKGSNPVFNSEYDNGVYSIPICHDKWRWHLTEKPLELIEALIKKHTNERALVLDCFSGSGSTAVASYNLNRDFIGCEISNVYYSRAIDRLVEFGTAAILSELSDFGTDIINTDFIS